MINGRDVILAIDGKTIAAAKTCTLEVSQDFIETCTPTGGRWRQYIPSKIGWSASVDMLVIDMANPQAWLTEMKSSQTALTMRYYDAALGIYQVGSVWIESWKSSASVGSMATFSLQLRGTGALSAATSADYPICAGGTLYTQASVDSDGVMDIDGTVDANGVWAKS